MYVKTIKRINLILFTFLLLITGCEENKPPEQTSPDLLTIYTSIYPLQYLTESIAGEYAHVSSIYPAGVDAHTYEPTSREMTEIAKADAFIYFGQHMEGFSDKIAATLASHHVAFIEIGSHGYLFREGNGSHVDPHIWLDPIRMIDMATIIKEELIRLNPEHTDEFNKAYDDVIEELMQLDEEFIHVLESKINKKIIVSHAAYGYWEERYGLEQLTISGISSTDEPSQKELVTLIKAIKEQGLDYIIFNQRGKHRLSTIVQQQTKTEKRIIHDLEVLTEEDIKNHEDYMSLMKKNLKTLDVVTH